MEVKVKSRNVLANKDLRNLYEVFREKVLELRVCHSFIRGRNRCVVLRFRDECFNRIKEIANGLDLDVDLLSKRKPYASGRR